LDDDKMKDLRRMIRVSAEAERESLRLSLTSAGVKDGRESKEATSRGP